MKLPTPPTQEPMRGLPFTSGSFSGLSLRSLFKPAGDNAAPEMSGTTFDKSRMRPSLSIMPGFSRPGAP